MYEENIALFLYEIAYMYMPIMSEESAVHLNNFIYTEYLKDKDTFNILFIPKLLDELFDDGYQPLPIDYILELLTKYYGVDKYAKLVHQAGTKTDKAINELVSKFLDYMQIVATLYYQEPIGYRRILS